MLCIVPRAGRVARLVCLLGFAWLAVAGGRATTYNIGVRAHATASSEKEPASNAIDGRIRVNGSGAWVSASTVTFWGVIDYPWIQLDWDESVVVSKVLLYDIPGEQSHTAGGELVFDDGSRVLVRAIPDNGAPCVVEFPAKRTRSLRFEVTDGNGSNLGLSEIEVNGPPSDCLTAVDPYIETTRGRYFFFATGSQPFGMISAAPLTRNKNQGGGGYNYNDNVVLGFPQVHAWMLSGLCLMPTTGSVDAGAGESAWKSAFSHDGEIVQPAYHRLFLDRYNVWVEQTNTDRASLYSMTFTEADDAAILLNLGGYVGTSTMVNAHVTKVEGSRIAGYFDTTGRLWGGGRRCQDVLCCRVQPSVRCSETARGNGRQPRGSHQGHAPQ